MIDNIPINDVKMEDVENEFGVRDLKSFLDLVGADCCAMKCKIGELIITEFNAYFSDNVNQRVRRIEIIDDHKSIIDLGCDEIIIYMFAKDGYEVRALKGDDDIYKFSVYASDGFIQHFH